MKEFFARLTMPSPNFFVKVQRFGLFLTGLSGLLLGLNMEFPGANIPPVVNDIAGYCAVAGMVITGIAKLTVSDKEALDEKLNK
jgi:hypothetical protein